MKKRIAPNPYIIALIHSAPAWAGTAIKVAVWAYLKIHGH